MDRIEAAFEASGLDNVETFIASGNVVFEGDGEVVRILGMPTTQRSHRTVQRIADEYLR